MKPDQYERDHALASEYVVGTLQGGARRRFQRWMMDSARLRRQVWYWERRLQTLNDGIVPVAPPEAAWARIEQRLFPQETPAGRTGIRFWRWATALALAALLVVLVWTPSATRVTPPSYMGVVQNQQAQPLWLLDASESRRQLTLKALPAVASPGTGHSFELWLLPGDKAPLSLGLLPTGGAELRITLSASQLKALLQSRHLAISIEPAGGSPTGQPTGPVVYQTHLLSL
ncbi:MAG: anti-sigma factor [Alcanivorax sp.]|nr:anti-sigma factor [Alcanivorax sp.]